MKPEARPRILLLLLFVIEVFYTSTCEAQRWRKVLDVTATSGIKESVILANGDIISLVCSDSVILVAMDQQGIVQWRRNLGKGIGLAMELIDEQLLVGGKTGSSFSDIGVLFKLSQDGNLIWQKTYDGGFISAIAKDGTGFFIGGNIDSPGSSSNSILYKIDANGTVLWKKEYDVFSNSGIAAIFVNSNSLFLVISASTVGVGFEGTVVFKTSKTDGQVVWSREKALGYYSNFPDDNDFLRPLDVSINAGQEIVISAPVNSTQGLIYSYSNDGILKSEVALNLTLPHTIHILPSGDYLIAGTLANTTEGSNAVVERRSPAGSIKWQRTIGQGSFLTLNVYGDTIIAAGTDKDFNDVSSYKPYVVKLTTDGRVYDSGIQFEVREDLNVNCITDVPDVPLEQIMMGLENYFFSTGPDGTVFIDVDSGTYEYMIHIPPFLQLCQPDQSIVVSDPNATVTENILLKREECSELSVGITYTEFIRGETASFYVQYNNNGSIDAQNVVLDIKLDSRLQLENVSSDYVITGEGIQISLPFLPANFSDRVRLDVRIDPQLVLFSTICVEASILPHSSCNPALNQWNGPELAVKAVCDNNEVVFRIKNDGTAMAEPVPYALFADGFEFEDGQIMLDAGEEDVFSVVPEGSTISIRSRQISGHPSDGIIGASIEGCGLQQYHTGSLGVVRMFDPASPAPWASRACIEVRDQYSADRVFEIDRGFGRYHIIDSTHLHCEFSFMYKNETGSPVDKVEFNIKPDWQFDLLSFREAASSHTLSHEILGNGIVRLASEHLNLLPGEQIQYRFTLKLGPSDIENEYVSVGVSGVINDSLAFSLFQGFYNRNIPTGVSRISPFTAIPNGRIFGRAHTFEFHEDLHIEENGNVIYAGSTHEFGVDARAFVMATAPDLSILWERAFAFAEGGVIFRTIIPAGEGRLLLVGSIDDNKEPDNFISDNYACMLMIDEHGSELWRRVWKPGNGAVVGGSLNNGHFYHEDKILLLGFRYTSGGARQFLLETDINGDIHWIRDFVLGTNTWGDPVTVINSIPMKVSPDGNIFIVASDYGYEEFIVKLDNEANILDQDTYSYNVDTAAVYIKDFVILEDEGLLMIGDGFSYDPDFNITSFGFMAQLSNTLEVASEIRFLEQFQSIELNAVTLHHNEVYAAGAIQVDTITGSDAVLIRSDLDGSNAKTLRIADFGAGDYGYSIDIGADGRIFAGVQTQTIDNFYNLQMGFFWADDTITAIPTIVYAPEHIRIFPNPAKDVVHIAMDKEIVSVNAFDMTGASVPMIDKGSNSYGIVHFTPGMYLLVIYTSDQKRYLAKLIRAE